MTDDYDYEESQVEMSPAAARHMESAKTPRHIVDAVIDLMDGPLVYEPRRVGKPLREPLEGLWSARRGDFRVLYVIDDERSKVTIVAVKHRADSYRPNIRHR